MLKSVRRLVAVRSALKSISAVRHCSSTSPLEYHSKPLRFTQANMDVILLPALKDNYMYLIIDQATKECACVDPVEPEKVLNAVKEMGVKLTTLMTTHHHWDHAGGNKELVSKCPQLSVFGGDKQIDGLKENVVHGDEFKIGQLNVRCLHTPCHTTGHICYYVTAGEGEDPAVFTGDTLFIAGCGRFFEGTPENMKTALIDILGELPPKTKVYCGHEYTVNNLKFALSVEPKNQDMITKMAWAQTKRNENKPTIPSTIGDEFKFNPFMRVREASVMNYTGTSDPVETMGFLRKAKDKF
ncbi:hydroxyacylglutathione hydrolase, mitochondrial-like [Ylistrum balloti]|uniref:hydroxyacylglutathione hydrolase, mitochondrial-like n=1 Tax=Ylistrum balloti TaxID=509963 RepID=UPI002905851B|nr:hydroxyacylglutathione hydrolase, mitochondrial-like [Ylistrum balloti]